MEKVSACFAVSSFCPSQGMKGIFGWRHLHFMGLKKHEVRKIKKSENDIFTECWHKKTYKNDS